MLLIEINFWSIFIFFSQFCEHSIHKYSAAKIILNMNHVALSLRRNLYKILN